MRRVAGDRASDDDRRGAHPPGLFLVWTATGPLELFWKQLEMESIAVCGDTKKYMFWTGK